MALIFKDIRFAVRGLLRSPLFAIVAILSLALGIGANTAIFTLIDQILLRKLPVRAPTRKGPPFCPRRSTEIETPSCPAKGAYWPLRMIHGRA